MASSRFSAKQRQAVVEAQLRNGLNADEAADAAARGELADLPPFTLSSSTARAWAGAERRDHAGPVDSEPVLAHLARLRAVVERVISELETHDPGTIDLGRAKQAVGVLVTIDQAERRLSRGRGTADAGSAEPDGDGDDFLGQLAGKIGDGAD